METGLVRGTCGHIVHEHAEWLPAEYLAKIKNELCDNCWTKAHNPQLVYDARSGAYVDRETANLVAGLSNPTAFVDRGNYAENENVEDGNGFGG